MNSAGKFGAGFLVGALLAASMFLIWPPADTEPESAAPTTTSMLPAATAMTEPFLEVGEVVIGSTVLLPRELDVENGVATLRYDLAGLSPSLVAHEDSEYAGDVLMMPESWVLTTRSGATVSGTTGPRDHSVRFEMPSPEDTVSQIHLVGWRVATQFGDRVDLPIEAGATGSLRSGEVVVETVLDQRNSTIVQIDFDHGDGEWGGGFARPLDQRWRVSGRQGGGVQLIWEGDGAPDRVVLEDATATMRPRTGEVLVVGEES